LRAGEWGLGSLIGCALFRPIANRQEKREVLMPIYDTYSPFLKSANVFLLTQLNEQTIVAVIIIGGVAEHRIA